MEEPSTRLSRGLDEPWLRIAAANTMEEPSMRLSRGLDEPWLKDSSSKHHGGAKHEA